MSLRPVFHVVGVLVTVLGLFMLVPATVDLVLHTAEWRAFAASSAIACFFGVSLALASQGELPPLTVRQAFLLTSCCWITVAVFGALPFMLSQVQLDWVDAFYETVSGLTTTAGTVMVGLDTMPPGILLWRALLNWLGGVGIIVMAMVVLPFLRVGGMQLFRTESSDRSQRPVAQARSFMLAIVLVYAGLTMTSTALLQLSGMGWFDAVCHAMAAVSTGGFSTRDASIGAFPSLWTVWAMTLSMTMGGLPLTFWIRLFQRGWRTAFDSQIRTFLAILVIASAVLTGTAMEANDWSLWTAFSHASMNATSIITSTGFASTDYSLWGPLAVVCFFFFYFIGGCTGSTTGSIKIYRWEILFLALRNQFLLMLQPHRTIVMVYNGKRMGPDVTPSVVSFVAAYVLCFALLSIVLAAFGLDFLTSTSAVAAALGNAGPGLGDLVGPSGNYAALPDGAKLVLCLAMLLGRLEIFTLLVIITPAFWRE